MWSDWVLKDDAPQGGARETYLVVDVRDGQLRGTVFMQGGLSRLVLPAVCEVEGRKRMSCAYEAERQSNPTPERPAHRGGWTLETGHSGDHMLTASYWSDRKTAGNFLFHHRKEALADTFPAARQLFADDEVWTENRAVRDRERLEYERGEPVS